MNQIGTTPGSDPIQGLRPAEPRPTPRITPQPVTPRPQAAAEAGVQTAALDAARAAARLAQQTAAQTTPRTAPEPPPRPAAATSGPQPQPGAAPRPQPRPPGGLAEQDIAALHSALLRGENALARQRDLGEMYRRTVEMVGTLGQGLGEQQLRKAAEDRSALIARMDRMEKSVNAMEGAVRIEMAPLMRSMIDEAMASHVARQERRGRGPLWLALGLVAGLGLGVAFSGNLAPLAERTLHGLTTALAGPADG